MKIPESVCLGRRELAVEKSKPNRCYALDGRPCVLLSGRCDRNPLTVICLRGYVFTETKEGGR